MIDRISEVRRFLLILDLEPGVTLEQVKAQYRFLAKVWHPDRFEKDLKVRGLAEEKLKEINEAYSWLVEHPEALIGVHREGAEGQSFEEEKARSRPAESARQSGSRDRRSPDVENGGVSSGTGASEPRFLTVEDALQALCQIYRGAPELHGVHGSEEAFLGEYGREMHERVRRYSKVYRSDTAVQMAYHECEEMLVNGLEALRKLEALEKMMQRDHLESVRRLYRDPWAREKAWHGSSWAFSCLVLLVAAGLWGIIAYQNVTAGLVSPSGMVETPRLQAKHVFV